MKPKTYYFQQFLGYSIGTFLCFMLLGDFYPVVKSLFFKDTDTSLLFWKTVAQVGWATIVIKPLFIGAFVAIITFTTDKRKSKNQ